MGHGVHCQSSSREDLATCSQMLKPTRRSLTDTFPWNRVKGFKHCTSGSTEQVKVRGQKLKLWSPNQLVLTNFPSGTMMEAQPIKLRGPILTLTSSQLKCTLIHSDAETTSLLCAKHTSTTRNQQTPTTVNCAWR